MSSSFINPYQLLGVTIDTTKEDLKRRYYELSLIMHPDKGGSDEDMRSLHTAYKFVLNEISNVNRDVTIEQLEADFKSFCSAQESAVPKFQDIFADAFDLPKFNEYFEASKQNFADEVQCMKASFEGGYGDMMEQSEFASVGDEPIKFTESVSYMPTETKKVQNDFSAVSVYKNTITEQGVWGHAYDIVAGTKGADNYTSEVNGLGMSDYKEAFANIDPSTFPNQEPEVRTLEQLQKEREETDYLEEKVLKEYTWSYVGFINSARQKISNILRLT